MPAKTTRKTPSARANRRAQERQLKEKAITSDQVTPVRITTRTKEEREPVPRVPLFYIDDMEYTVPSEFAPSIGLRYLRDLRDEGRDYAISNLMTEVLGKDGFDALANCEDVEREQIDSIIDSIIGLAMGSVDAGKD